METPENKGTRIWCPTANMTEKEIQQLNLHLKISGKKCRDCGSTKQLAKINEKPEYACLKCWDLKGYEYDPTPW